MGAAARLGAELGEATLTALGLAVEGVEEVRLGHVDMIAVCHDLADPQRARRWTETTERWCAQFSSAAMNLGICRVRRVQLLNLAGA